MAGLLRYQGGRSVFAATDAGQVQYRTREEYLRAQEEARRHGISARRAYYEGTQYDERNAACLRELASSKDYTDSEKAMARAMLQWTQQLPEHLRLHEYSTQIQEAVDFIANRLSHKFSVQAKNTVVDGVIRAAMDASPELSGTEDDDDTTVVNVMREPVKVGDVPVRLRWDPDQETVWMEFWDSEAVEMRFLEGRPDVLQQVIVEEIDWLVIDGEEQPITKRRIWQVIQRFVNEAQVQAAVDANLVAPDPEFRLECVEEVWLVRDNEEEDELLDVIPWGVPFLPWWLIRGDKNSLRAVRGEALITEQSMKTADRFNAVEQVSWLIARYNSHSNLVVTGDNALLMQQEAKKLAKDVADVLLFPGATNAFTLALPTDPQMIEHQRQVLLDGLYGTLGITRVDQTSLEGLGGVTGYALEILNQKSDGTFSRVRQQMIRDWKKLLNLVLDCTAFWQQAPPERLNLDLTIPFDGTETEPSGTPYDDIDPRLVFPDRAMTVNIGSGYIVDDVKLRDDFVSGLISQEEALRKRGMGPDEIAGILAEIGEATRRKAEEQRIAFGETGTETGAFRPGTAAGRTTAGTTSRGAAS